MEKDDFKAYLVAASYWAIQCAKIYVKEKLQYEFVYDVKLNQSFDDTAGDEFVRYPKDEGKTYFQQSIDEVVALLARDGRVPVWIDINVKSFANKITTLELLCAGRFTKKKDELYYQARGQGPFGIKSPNHPLGWKNGKRFWLKNSRPPWKMWQKIKYRFNSFFN